MRSSRPPVAPLQASAAMRSVSASSPGGVSTPNSASSSSRLPSGHHPQQQQWEDEAWTVDSDDEDFVCRQQQQHLASQAVAAAAAASGSASASGQKHAPPAQPHQYRPLRSTSYSSVSGSASVEAGDGLAQGSGARPIPSRSPTGSGNVPAGSPASGRPHAPHLNSRTSWLLVDSVPSPSASSISQPSSLSGPGGAPIPANPISAVPLDLDAAIAGSPPTDLGPSAEAAVYNASFLGGAHPLQNDPSTPGTTSSLQSGSSDVTPLTRAPSSRSKRRWTEFVKALGGVTPPSPAAAIALTNGAADADTADPSLSAASEAPRSLAVNLDELRKAAWKGVPDELRPMVWMLLLGYLPPQPSARSTTLARKRSDYAAAVEQAFGRGRGGLDQTIWHQIEIDVPRTNPGIPLWQREATQRSLERILYVWALRHPASGYVQGIADLATPFYEVFLSAYIDSDPEKYDVANLPSHTLQALEADTFWCLSKLLDGIQDNYIFAQPGIQRQVKLMGELVARIDAPLHQHLAEQNVQYMQFAFRWMNCLLMREMSVRNIVRMWDTYIAEGPDAFSDFHPFVCAVLLRKWSARLMEMDFQGIIMFLQNLPTKDWSNADAEDLLAQAFMYKSLFGNTAHLR
ncbi:GTPase-activating protein [Tilletia horrida]|nr:GTPase-activating protein [Tilletia horrida]